MKMEVQVQDLLSKEEGDSENLELYKSLTLQHIHLF